MTGKGSSPRPLSVSEEEFGQNFERIDWSVHRYKPIDGRPISGDEPLDYPVPGTPIWGAMAGGMPVPSSPPVFDDSGDFGLIAVDFE